jgi:hypothetical protein
VSRRRGPKPPEQQPPVPDVRYISVVCTGRGRHPVAPLQPLFIPELAGHAEDEFARARGKSASLLAWPAEDRESGWVVFAELINPLTGQGYPDDEGRAFYTPAMRADCRKCGHRVVLNPGTVQRVGAELAALSEAPRLDISFIP